MAGSGIDSRRPLGERTRMNRIAIAAALGFGALLSSPLLAQDFHAGFGAGSEVRTSGGPRVFGGEIGLDFEGPVGVRLEGFETIGLFFLGPAVTLDLATGDAPVEPFLLAGTGGAMTVAGFVGSWLQAGGGLYWPLVSHAGLYGEGAAVQLIQDGSGDRTLLTVRVGVRLYPFGRR